MQTGRNYKITVSTARTFRHGKKQKANVITYGSCKVIHNLNFTHERHRLIDFLNFKLHGKGCLLLDKT